MATLLTHQLQQQSNNQLHYNAPNHHHLLNINVANQGHQSGHFCKDCGVMFESQTSLEVHLSYHKENLLTRWASQAQDNLDKSSNSSSGSGSSGALLLLNPSSPSPIKRERSDNSSVESNTSSQYFHPMDSHPPLPSHYLPPLYNNNTGDQHMEHSPTTPTASGATGSVFLQSHHQQPVESNGIMYDNFHSNFHSPHGHPGGGHPLFSPNPGSDHLQSQQQAARESAEILDLDSHKVHIYQHQQQQQQQQQQQGFFHRPYLPHLLPPLPPPPPQQPNGWNGEHHFSSRFSPAGYTIDAPTNAFYPAPPLITTTTSAPPTSNGMSPATYEIVRMENPNFSPSSEGQQQQQQNFSQTNNGPPTNGPVLASFGHQSPYAAPVQQQPPQVQVKLENASPPGVVAKAQRSPLEGGGVNNKNGTQSPVVKTKGWKGGECKRPKTYNCPACNKWFTSSGHLKRHYGTTLHKNSMKQLGDNAEELFKQQPRKKGGNKAQSNAEPKTPKTPKAQKIRNTSPNEPTSDEMPIKGKNNEGAAMYGGPVPAPLLQMNDDGELVGMKPHFGNLTHPPTSSPNAFNNYHPYVLPPNSHLLPPHVPYPNNNGYVLDFVPQQQQQQQQQQVPPPPPPPSSGSNAYNGFPGPNGNGTDRERPLPPFSSVGLSHYDGSSDMNGGMDANFQNRVTPPYHHGGMPQQMNSTPSPHNNSGQRDTSYESLERENNGRSSEGSLDGSDVGGALSSSSSASSEVAGRVKETKEVHKCPDCSKTFNRSCYFKQHFKQLHSNSHSGGPLFKCHTCGKRFPAEPALTDHLAKHGSDKPYKCELCPKQFNHKTDLNRHRLLHTGDRPFVCDQCGKGFIRKDHMSKHTETHRKKLQLTPN